MIFKGVPLCERFSCTDMMMMNLAALLLALTAVTIASGRLLQLDDDDKETFVSEHNRLRAAVTPAARNMKKLKWSNTLAAEAGRHVSQCIFGHSSNRKYGENIYATTSSSLNYKTVVRAWNNEKKDYNYHCNSCNTGKVCGHYTQVVWGKTTKIGCAVAFCPTIRNRGWTNALLVMCSYDPAGNVRGQRPYDIKKKCKTVCRKCPNVKDLDCICEGRRVKKPGVITKAEKNNILKLHKTIRTSVTPKATDMSPIKWDKTMAGKAQTHAENCKFATNSLGYAENIHFSQGITPDFNATIMSWYNQRSDYNYYCNQCRSGRRCNRYLQLVRSTVKKVGCGSHICPTVNGLIGWKDVWIFTCFYDSRVVTSQRPYKTKDTCSQICSKCSTAPECRGC